MTEKFSPGSVEGQTIAAPAQPEVAGQFNRPLWEFERDCRVLLGEEQRKPNPDNAIIAALCDSVRLVRDYAAVLFQEKLAAVVDRAGTERSAPAAPTVYLLTLSDPDSSRVVAVFAQKRDAEQTLAAIEAVPFTVDEEDPEYRWREVVINGEGLIQSARFGHWHIDEHAVRDSSASPSPQE